MIVQHHWNRPLSSTKNDNDLLCTFFPSITALFSFKKCILFYLLIWVARRDGFGFYYMQNTAQLGEQNMRQKAQPRCATCPSLAPVSGAPEKAGSVNAHDQHSNWFNLLVLPRKARIRPHIESSKAVVFNGVAILVVLLLRSGSRWAMIISILTPIDRLLKHLWTVCIHLLTVHYIRLASKIYLGSNTASWISDIARHELEYPCPHQY